MDYKISRRAILLYKCLPPKKNLTYKCNNIFKKIMNYKYVEIIKVYNKKWREGELQLNGI